MLGLLLEKILKNPIKSIVNMIITLSIIFLIADNILLRKQIKLLDVSLNAAHDMLSDTIFHLARVSEKVNNIKTTQIAQIKDLQQKYQIIPHAPIRRNKNGKEKKFQSR